MINKTLFDKIAKNSNKIKKYPEIDMFIFQNKETILYALQLHIPIKAIYETIVEETSMTVSYKTILKKLKKLKADSKIQPKQLQQENSSVVSIANTTVINDKTPDNKNEEQKPPLSKNKQKLEALKKKLEETNGIIDGDKNRDKFVWTPTRRE